MFRFIDWKYIWMWVKWPVFVVIFMFLSWLWWGCSTFPGATEVQPVVEQIQITPDPLEVDRKQKESVSMYLERYGQPTLFWSYSDDDLKFEVFQWKKASPERWAIRINGVYKFTWTQLKTIKEEK